MKKLVLFTAICFGLICMIQKNTHAQSQKTTIGILPTKYTDGKYYTETNAITDALTTAFSKAKRFILVDRTQVEAIKKEKELQKSEDFIDGSTVEQGKSQGAQFLISSSLTSYKNDGKVCKFSLTLNVIDVTTGQIIKSDIVDCKGGGHGGDLLGAALAGATKTTYTPGPGDKEKTLKKALESVSNRIDDFIANNFPTTFTIVEIQEKDVTTGEATKILIAGGSAFNLQKGDKLKVVELSEIEVDGKKIQRKTEIGELKITKVEDENFSTCTVKSGGISINAKFTAKAKLQVITEPR